MAYTGNSIVDYLKSTGQASDFQSRSALAASKGIQSYSGTADQNVQLLNLLRGTSQPVSQPMTQQQAVQTPINQGAFQSGGSLPGAAPQVPSPVQSQGAFQGGSPIPTAPVQQPIPQPIPQTGQQTYQVQSGDTISAIASRIGVPASSITGFRSGNPNLIYPGETLNVSSVGTQPISQPATTQPITPGQTPLTPEQATQKINELSEQLKPLQEKLQKFQEAGERGLEVTPETEFEEVEGFLSQYGIDVDQGKAITNPAGSWQETYQQLFGQLGLDKVKENINNTISKIEGIENERAEKISDINDNPWISEAERSRQISKANNEYDAKTSNLSSALTLYQNTYNQGREEAQFLVTTALNQYNTDRSFDFQEQKFLADQAEAQAKAIADLTRINPAVYKSVQGGLLNVETGEWVVPPKADDGGLSEYQKQSAVDKISTSFDNSQIVKNFNDVLNKKQSVESIIESGVGGPGDLALVFEFMKALDPTSVVRESEYESAAKSGNIFKGVLAKFNGYLKEEGGFLPGNVKDSFMSIINSKYGVIESQYDNLKNEKARLINQKLGVPEGGEDFLIDYKSGVIEETKTSDGLTSTQISRLEDRGVNSGIANQIFNDIRSGIELKDIREEMKKDGVDPIYLDYFDQIVGIENIK